MREPAWPSGKGARLVSLSGRTYRFDSPLRLTFLFKPCALWTLSHRDLALHNSSDELRLGSATQFAAGFPRGKRPEFSMGKVVIGTT